MALLDQSAAGLALRTWSADRPRTTDVLQALAIAVCSLLVVASAYGEAPPAILERYPEPWQVALAAVAVYGPLAVRRRAPLHTLGLTTVGYGLVAYWAVPDPIFASAALFLALYTVGDRSPRPAATHARAAVVVAVSVYSVLLLSGALTGPPDPGPWSLESTASHTATTVAFFVVAWRFGDTAHQRREREQELAERNRELSLERAENARRAVLDERVRIARELHDVVAHSVSVMGIQAGAARRSVARDPDVAVDALASIERTSREAVGELQLLLGFLRDEDPSADGEDRQPQPGVDRLEALVAQTTASGVPTHLTVTGLSCELPSGLAVSVYRIVQEALTNTLRHAGARTAEVLLRYEGDALEVEVLDDGRGPVHGDGVPGPARWSGGHGLIGMRERTALHGGLLEVGARPGGGYRVWARLPVDGHQPARQPVEVAR